MNYNKLVAEAETLLLDPEQDLTIEQADALRAVIALQ